MVEDPSQSMLVAILIRARLKSKTPENLRKIWDARLAVGIGQTDFQSMNLTTSDGEAFRLSGRGFDALGKDNISVHTMCEWTNDELNVSTGFVNDTINEWTASQAKIVYMALSEGLSQKEISERLGQTKHKPPFQPLKDCFDSEIFGTIHPNH